MWPRLGGFTRFILLMITAAIDMGSTAIGIMRTAAMSRRNIGNGYRSMAWWVSILGVLVSPDPAFLGWWATSLFM